MKILKYIISYVFIVLSLSAWGRPDDSGCRDKSDIVTDMVLDDSSNFVCPKQYSFYDPTEETSGDPEDHHGPPRRKRAPPSFAR